MMRFGLLALALACLGLVSAAAVSINACGNYAGTGSADVFTIDQSITATGGSTITDGGCVVITINVDTDTVNYNNKTITNSGSSAIYGLVFLYDSVGATPITNTNRLAISGFQNGVLFNWTARGSTTSLSGVSVYNATNGIYLAGSSLALSKFSGTVLGCNLSYAAAGNGLANVSSISLSNASGCLIADLHNTGSTLDNTATGLSAFYADSPFSMDFTFIGNSIVNQGNGTRTYSLPDGMSLNATNVSSSKWIALRSLNLGYTYGLVNVSANLTIDGYYCPSSSFCNHLWLSNYTAFPFYIRIPSEGLYTVPLDVSADELYIYQVVGTVEYLVFSDYAPYSKQCQSNTKICTYLVNGGQYHVRTVTGGLATDTYTQVQCATSDICYLTGFSGNIPDVVVYTSTGSCSQVNSTASKCIYYTDDPNGTSYNWTMRMYRLNDSVLACQSNATGAVGTLYCDMPSSVSATVLLYANNGTSAITGSFHSASAASISQMWLLFYVAAALALIYVSTSIPIIMALAEIALCFVFWSAGILPDNLMSIIFLGWLGVLFVFIFGSFKKDNKAG